MIIPVSVVLNRTDNLCGSRLQLDYTHLDDHIPPTYEMTPGFKAFTFFILFVFVQQYTQLQSLQGNKDSELEELKSSKQELDAVQAKVRIFFFLTY